MSIVSFNLEIEEEELENLKRIAKYKTKKEEEVSVNDLITNAVYYKYPKTAEITVDDKTHLVEKGNWMVFYFKEYMNIREAYGIRQMIDGEWLQVSNDQSVELVNGARFETEPPVGASG